MSNKENRLPENSYICIQSFMVNDLDLSGNELLVYGLIYGFCQDKNSEFRGSLTYIEKWLNASRKTVTNVLKRLREKDLIIKTHITTASNDTNHYVINFDALRNLTSVKTPLVTSENNTLVENLHQQKVIEKDQVKTSEDSTLVKDFPETSVKITRNNINNNIYSNSQTSKVNVALSNDSSKFNEDEKKKKEKELAEKINLTCPNCGRIYPDTAIKYIPGTTTCYCKECNVSWNAIREKAAC